jgi:cysteine desulfurase/selenocysteine lyase
MTTSENAFPSVEQISAWANEFFRGPGSQGAIDVSDAGSLAQPPQPSAADASVTGLDLSQGNPFASAPQASGVPVAQPAVPATPPYYPNLPLPTTPSVLPIFPTVSQPTAASTQLPFATGLAQPAIPAIPPFYPAIPQPSLPYVAPNAPSISQPTGLNGALPFASGYAQPSLPGLPPFSPAVPQPSSPAVLPVLPNVSQPSAAGMSQLPSPNAGIPGASSFAQPAVPSGASGPGAPQAPSGGDPYFDAPHFGAPNVPSTAQPSAASIAPPSAGSVPQPSAASITPPSAGSVPQPSAPGMGGFVYPDTNAANIPGYYFLSEANSPRNQPSRGAQGDSFSETDRLLSSGHSASRDPRIESSTKSSALAGQQHQAYDVEAIRADFPILQERVQGRPLVWLDNAATTQKPNVVIERISQFYARENSNIHRAAHTLAARATDAYEAARQSVRRFLNASSAEEIIFVRGTTEGINLIAQTFGKRFIEAGDEIIISHIEHHSNIVPWQMLCQQTGAKLRVAPVDNTGQILLDDYERLFNSRTRLVSFTQVSNALGTVLPVDAMVKIAHRYGARAVIDGAQAVCHMPVDVQTLDCDFYVFSGHKVFGPTGIGVVYGKKALLDAMPPYQGGGNMIGDVTFEKTTYQPAPMKFEAGTGNIADAVGLGAALDYLQAIGVENVNRHEHELLEYGLGLLREVPGLRLIGTAAEKAAVMGFVLEDVPTEQVGAALAAEGIAVRAGHHCAQPALRRFGVESTVRPSLALYNNKSDIDALVTVLHRLTNRWLR